MKDFTGTVIATAKNQLELLFPLIWLLEIEVPTTPVKAFRLTNYNQQVSRGVGPPPDNVPLIYYPFPIAIGELRETNKGDLTDLTLNVGNATKDLMPYLEQYDGMDGQRVTIRLVSSQALTDPNAQREDDFRIARAHVDQDVVTLSCGATNLTRTLFPKNRFIAHHCGVRFGGPECGYVVPASPGNTIGTGFSLCGRTPDECRIRGLDEVARSLPQNHPLRLGCFPGIVQQVVNTG